MKHNHLINLLINLLFLILIFFTISTCEKPERDNPWDAMTNLAPGSWVPQSFQSEMAGITAVKLTWTYGNHNIEGFRLDRKKGEQEWQVARQSFSPEFLTWVDEDITLGLTYFYRLYAFAGENKSSTQSTSIYASLAPPAEFNVDVLSPTSVSLSWEYGHSDNDGFKIDKMINEEEWQEEFTVLASDRDSYIDQEVDLANNLYRYMLYAYVGEYTSEKTEVYISLPVLSTTQITSITATLAFSGGEITDDGGVEVTARGVVWSTDENPTLIYNVGVTEEGIGKGEFTSELSGLEAGVTYYVRAYATNSIGTAYGQQESFTTLSRDWCYDTNTEVVAVTSPATGKVWMDRNLGASRAATSSTDEEAYGYLYQWGRAADSHQVRTSDNISQRSNSDTPGHGNFILSGSYANWDWRSPQNDNLWQGVNGFNNPCPPGYRLPTEAEFNAERLSWSSTDAAGAFDSPLKLPVAGFRSQSSGVLYNMGSIGYYWSCTLDDLDSRYLVFSSSDAGMNFSGRAQGFSIRCIKND